MKFKKKYNLVFITTHQSENYIYNLLNSIKNSVNIELLVIVLSQDLSVNIINYESYFDVHAININRMGLSKARNIGLNFLKENSIKSEFIMFPDDDSSFDNDFFENFANIKEADNSFIIPIFEEKSIPKKLYMGKILDENTVILETNHNLIGSPNQLIRYNANIEELFFDEKLGVGAIYGSCEDYDLFIRLVRSGEKFLYTSKLYNFHPKKTYVYKNMSFEQIVKRFKNYSTGFCFVIFKYDLKQFIFMFLLRTFIASIVFFLKLNFKLSLAYLIQFFDRIILIQKFSKNKTW